MFKDPIRYAKVAETGDNDPRSFAIDKGRLYGIAEILEMQGYVSCARDVRTAADYIHDHLRLLLQ
jgi:hypothetical protein